MRDKKEDIDSILNAMKMRELADSGMTLSEFCDRYGMKKEEDNA